MKKIIALLTVTVLSGIVVVGAIFISRDDEAGLRASNGASHESGSLVSGSPPAPVANETAAMTPDDAQAANALLPFSNEPIEPALPIIAGPTLAVTESGAAARCLTAAIYYEAGYETLEGQRAVAQVVLNRVRHPSFPNSICAVVNEGSERSTGCQFTFTCDGSLTRPLDVTAWSRAAKVAQEALNGHVAASVGLSTHYHANYVFPHWAPSLRKVVQIGSHIFYGWKGSWGRRRAFTQQPLWAEYGAVNQLPIDQVAPAPESIISALAPLGSELSADRRAGAPPAASRPIQSAGGAILADENSGTLLLDQKTGKANETGSLDSSRR